MKKLLPLLLILMSGTAAHASMSTRHQTSLQLSVDAARTITSRTANSYSVSGSGVGVIGLLNVIGIGSTFGSSTFGAFDLYLPIIFNSLSVSFIIKTHSLGLHFRGYC